MISTAVLAATLVAPGLEARVSQSTLDGAPRGLYALDVTGDGLRDAVVVLARDGERRIVVLDGRGLEAPLAESAPASLRVAHDAAYFGTCPGIGAGLLIVKPGVVERHSPDGAQVVLARVPNLLAVRDPDDLPFLELCPAGDAAMLLPTFEGVARVSPVGEVLPLDLPLGSHLTGGDTYRGPRARQDFSLMLTRIFPRLYRGDADGDGQLDLAASLEDQVTLVLASGAHLHVTPPQEGERLAPGLRSTLLADLTGDGVLDALYVARSPGLVDAASSWRLRPGPLGEPASDTSPPLRRPGVAGPTQLCDLDGDGTPEVLESRIEIGVLEATRALLTRRIPVSYYAHSFKGRGHRASAPLTLTADIDLRGASLLSGLPPLVEADFNDDGRVDLIDLGKADRLAVHLGRSGEPPFTLQPALEEEVPRAQHAVSLRLGATGSRTILLLGERDGNARLTAVHLLSRGDEAANDSGAPAR